MASIFDRYPNAVVAVSFNGGLIDPEDYPSAGISVSVVDGVVTLTAPDIGDAGGEYRVAIVAEEATVAGDVRLVQLELLDESASFYGCGVVGPSPVEFEVDDVIPPGDPALITSAAGWVSAYVFAGRAGA